METLPTVEPLNDQAENGQYEIKNLAEFYDHPEEVEAYKSLRKYADEIWKVEVEKKEGSDKQQYIEDITANFASDNPRISPSVLTEYVDQLGQQEKEIAETFASDEKALLKKVIENMSRGELIDQKTFGLLVGQLDLQNLGPDRNLAHKGYRETLTIILEHVRNTPQHWPYISLLFNSIQDKNLRTSFIAYSRVTGMIHGDEMFYVIRNTDDMEPIAMKTQIDQKIASLMGQTHQQVELSRLIEKARNLIVNEKKRIDDPQVEMIFDQLRSMGYSRGLADGLLKRSVYEEVDAKINARYEASRELKSGLEEIITNLEGATSLTPALKDYLVASPDKNGGFQSKGFLITALEYAKKSGDKLGVEVLTYIRDNIDTFQDNPGKIKEYLLAYKNLPVTYRKIEEEFIQAKLSASDNLLRDLDSYATSFEEMGLQAVSNMQEIADNLSDLTGLKDALNKKITELKPQPLTYEVLMTTIDSFAADNTIDLRQVLNKVAFAVNAPGVDKVDFIVKYLKNIGTNELGLGVLHYRHKISQDMEDIGASVNRHHLAAKYKGLTGFLKETMGEAKTFGELSPAKQEILKVKLVEMQKIAKDSDLTKMSDKIGVYLKSINSSEKKIRNAVSLMELSENLENYQKDVENFSGISVDLSLAQITAATERSFSRLDSAINADDLIDFDKKMAEVNQNISIMQTTHKTFVDFLQLNKAKKISELDASQQKSFTENMKKTLTATTLISKEPDPKIYGSFGRQAKKIAEMIEAYNARITKKEDIPLSVMYTGLSQYDMSAQAEEARSDAYSSLFDEIHSKYNFTENMSFERGALVQKNTIFNCRNSLMRQMDWEGLLNAGMGFWGFMTALVNIAAALGSLVSTGAIGGDWDTAINTAIKNMPYSFLGITALTASIRNIQRQEGQEFLPSDSDPINLARFLGKQSFKEENGTAELKLGDSPKQTALQILGARSATFDKRQSSMFVYKLKDGADTHNLYGKNSEYLAGIGYKAIGFPGKTENDSLDKLAQFMADTYTYQDQAKWKTYLSVNKGAVLKELVGILSYAKMPNNWSALRLSRAAAICVDYLPENRRRSVAGGE